MFSIPYSVLYEGEEILSIGQNYPPWDDYKGGDEE